jgi:chromosome segregation ATPase
MDEKADWTNFSTNRDLHSAQVNETGRTMKYAGTVKQAARCGTALCVAAVVVAAALAQDVPGIEICTRESQMDRRTGCLQSNVEFLQKVVTRNALDAQQKLSAANREIAALKEQLATASREAAALKSALSAMEAKIAQLEKAASKPDAKPQGK